MIRKFRWLLVGLAIVLAFGSFFACEKNKPETEEQKRGFVDAAMTAVTLPVNVTENLTLPTMSGDVAISWTSDKTAVVSNAGAVTRPAFGADDEEVKLTGSFSYKEHSDTKVYTVSVKAIAEKVFTFANGHTGENAVFTAPESGAYGTVTDKGDGVITLKPTENEGRKNAPYYRMSAHMPTYKESGFTSEVMIYIDHTAMTSGGTFIIDYSLSDKDGDWFGGIFFTLAANDNNVVITESQSPETEKFVAAPGWYTLGVKYHDNNGKLHAKAFIKDMAGAEVHTWTNTKFKGFAIEETSGELEDISTSQIGAPRSLWFTDMNITAIDVKQVKLAYNI